MNSVNFFQKEAVMNIMDEIDPKGAKRREYDKLWAKRNPLKVKANRDRFWEKYAAPGEDINAARRRYYREWRAANKHKVWAAKLRYQLKYNDSGANKPRKSSQ